MGERNFKSKTQEENVIKEMKKIGIITINDDKNYGNRLQNFAMQRWLEDFGYCVQTVRTQGYRDWYYKRKDPIIFLKIFLLNIFKKNVSKVIDREELLVQRRKQNFKHFNTNHISYYNKIIKSEFVPRKIKKDFDYFVTGSDQVWNPNFWLGTHTMYLHFAPRKKRIAIAASFGVDQIPARDRELITKYLRGMNYISVREESGRQIVEELTGESCDVILDPTLLVNPMVWYGIAEEAPIQLPERYVLTYLLGDVSAERKAYISNYAKENNCKIINMNNISEPDVYVWGPGAFLKAIKQSSCFFTDSFHGCVFSILFHRQFVVFRRQGEQNNMFGRIETLLNTVGLKECEINEERSLPDMITEEKYDTIDRILHYKRVEAKKRLKRVLLQTKEIDNEN